MRFEGEIAREVWLLSLSLFLSSASSTSARFARARVQRAPRANRDGCYVQQKRAAQVVYTTRAIVARPALQVVVFCNCREREGAHETIQFR